MAEQIPGLYNEFLGRTPSPDEAAWWANHAQQTQASPDVLRQQFRAAAAPEMVTGMYRTFLGREPEQAGLDHHVNLLNSGVDRHNIARHLNQEGMLGELGDSGSMYQRQARAYTTGLNSMPGVMSSANMISATPGVAQEYMYPAEMNAWRAQMQNPVLAGNLYGGTQAMRDETMSNFQTVLGREPTEDEIRYWVGRSLQGATFDQFKAEMAPSNPVLADDDPAASASAGNPLFGLT